MNTLRRENTIIYSLALVEQPYEAVNSIFIVRRGGAQEAKQHVSFIS